MTRLALLAVSLLAAPTTAQEKANDESIRPFKIAVPDDVLTDLQNRLKRTRWPDQPAGTGWDLGVPLDTMKDLVAYWQTVYDWRKEEKKLNDLPQFMTRIDGIDVHFVHVRSKHKEALPLVIVHGWPGSFVEFQKVIGSDSRMSASRAGSAISSSDASRIEPPAASRPNTS